MQAIARRGRDLAIISDRQYRYLMQQISARGWRTNEPEFSPMKPELPRALKKMVEVVFGPSAKAATIAHRFDLSESFVAELLSFYAMAPGKPQGKETTSGGIVLAFKT